MPAAKRGAKAPPAPEELDRELGDDEPEAIEQRDDAGDPIVVLSRSALYELVYNALAAGTEPLDPGPGVEAKRVVDSVEFQEVGEAGPLIPATTGHVLPGLPEARVSMAGYPARERHNDIRRPAQALAAAASRAEEAVTAGIETAADLIVVAVEPGLGDAVYAYLKIALGLAPAPEPEPAVQD